MKPGVRFHIRDHDQESELAIGPGKIALLEAIDETGSITSSAKRLGMSYRRAWLLVEETISLREGDLYVFFTDGISEAMNASGDLYGLERIQTQMLSKFKSVGELGKFILDDVKRFVGTTAQSDDMCLMCFGRGAG